MCVCVCDKNGYDWDVHSSYQQYQLTEICESRPCHRQLSSRRILGHLSQLSSVGHLAVPSSSALCEVKDRSSVSV